MRRRRRSRSSVTEFLTETAAARVRWNRIAPSSNVAAGYRMRPSILNPLFAEASVLKGVGPAVARGLARLGLNRVVDLLFHLPVGVIERFRVTEVSAAYVDRIVTVELRVLGHDSGGPRSPLR